MANINIELNEELHKKLRHKAVEDDTTIKDIVIKAIEQVVK